MTRRGHPHGRSLVELAVHPDVWLDRDALADEVARAAKRVGPTPASWHVVRKSIDARRGKVRLQLQVELVAPGAPASDPTPEPPALAHLVGPPEVAIVGAGPAGMFCAWELARRGIKAVILERGKRIRPRRLDLAALARRGELDPESNYCFGEGGAGTFSDGKLYTRAHKRGDVEAVLRAFVAYGAPPEILVDARPHIGTNRLPGVVTRMREHLESAGVEFAFETRVEGLRVSGARCVGVRLAGGEALGVRAVVVAPGHSARDVQRWLAEAGARVEPKPFAIGIRVEHPQSFIDAVQFGALAGHPALGAAAYRLVEKVDGVGVFSFCMCPGGFMCPAATEPGAQVVNGWSPSSRRGRYANSGLVTEVGQRELQRAGFDPGGDLFAGVAYQAALERTAYAVGGGGYVAPAQRLDDFVAGRPSTDLPECSYPRGLTAAPLDEVLGDLAAPIRAGLLAIDRRMVGFAGADAVGVALESRTSCPLRTVRDPETGQSPTLPNLYPCGEGAGYAGGIMSAALDGIRTASHIALARGGGSENVTAGWGR